MLHEFLATHRDTIITRTREKMTNRPWPLASTSELQNGVPLFLAKLSDALRCEATATPVSSTAIGEAATRHGSELLALGFNVSQVVHDYGDICQAVTEIALEQQEPVTTDEFHTLNRCLDDATAEAVTEHARLTAERTRADETDRLGLVAHELRIMLSTALFAFQTLKHGYVAINGSTGMVLGRTLMSLRDTIDSTLCEVRLNAGAQRQQVPIAALVNEVAVVANLHAEYRQIRFRVEHVPDDLTIKADPQLLMSAVLNLLTNAFRFTPANRRVKLWAHERDEHLLIEVEDECGGMPDTKDGPLRTPGDRRRADRTGLGLGLSMARRAVRAQGGDIHIRNIPGRGCVFAIDIPMTAGVKRCPL